MFKEPTEKIKTDLIEEKVASEHLEEEKGETTINEVGELEKIESFRLDQHTRDIIREHFIKKDFEVIEMTDSHVKVRSPGGKTMTIDNEVAAKYFTSYR